MNVENAKRTATGLGVAIVFFAVAHLLLVSIPDYAISYESDWRKNFWPGAQLAMLTFSAALGGSFVAKVNFVRPAVVLSVCIWLLLVYVLYQADRGAIAFAYFLFRDTVKLPDSSIVLTAAASLPSLFLGIMGAAFGAAFGRRLAKQIGRSASHAA